MLKLGHLLVQVIFCYHLTIFPKTQRRESSLKIVAARGDFFLLNVARAWFRV